MRGVLVGGMRLPGKPGRGRLGTTGAAAALVAVLVTGCTAGTVPGFRVAEPTPRIASAQLSSAPLTPAPNIPGSPETGRTLFTSKGCVGCHTLNGYPGATGVEGPNLTNMPLRPTIAGETIQNSADNLARWIQDPPSLKPDTRMPNLGLSSQEARDLAAYLYSVPYNTTR
jgi:cytochrome c